MKRWNWFKQILGGVLLALTSLAGHAADTPVWESKVYYLQNDHLGTPKAVTDSNDRVVWRNEGEPFGNTLPDEDPDGDGKAFTLNLRFPGQYYDQETQRNQNFFRDYNPETGRYIQSDPIGLRAGPNTFAYVSGNPVSYTDSLGLYTEVIRWATDGSGSGAWGHISGNVNGQNFSWGPGGWDSRTSASDYVRRQVDDIKRDGRGVILDMSPTEEVKLASCLRRTSSPYHGVTNNCGNPWLSCLQELGVVNANDKARILPLDVIQIIESSSRTIGQTNYSSPGNKSFDIPPARPIADAIRHRIGQ